MIQEFYPKSFDLKAKRVIEYYKLKIQENKTQMAKFVKFGDMFKWNKNLLEDDYNEGKLYIVKHKKTLSDSASIETNFKVDEMAKGGAAHKLAADHKLTLNTKEFGGVKCEMKGTQEGKMEIKNEMKGAGVSLLNCFVSNAFFFCLENRRIGGSYRTC